MTKQLLREASSLILVAATACQSSVATTPKAPACEAPVSKPAPSAVAVGRGAAKGSVGSSAPESSTSDVVATPIVHPVSPEASFDPAVLVATDLAEHFEAEGVSGAFVGFDASANKGWVYQSEFAAVGYLPASTFKIANAIVALETGVVTDADFVIPWDQKRRWHPNWNMDLDLRAAMRVSGVPYFQEVARRVGAQPMQEWLKRLGYGNQNIDGGIDHFWLTGSLRISALQQVAFLQKMRTNQLPISQKTQETVRDILFFGRRGDATIYAKTGSTDPEHSPHNVNWFVGWVERAGTNFYFATLLVDPPKGKWFARMHVADRVLSAIGAL